MSLDPANLFVAFMVGLVGTALLMWGRSQQRVPFMAGGVLLIAITFLVSGWLWLLLATALVIAALVATARVGL